MGIQPDILICRSERFIRAGDEGEDRALLRCGCGSRGDGARREIRLPCCRWSSPPKGVDEIVLRLLRLDSAPPRDLSQAGAPCWRSLDNPQDEVNIGIVGKYVEYEDSYKSLKEALLHGGLAHQLKVNIHWIEAEGVTGENLGSATRRLRRHPGAGRFRQARYRRHAQRHPLRA